MANFAHLGGAVGGFLVPLLFRVKRDTSEASGAKASLDEMKSLFLLPPYEVQEIAKADP